MDRTALQELTNQFDGMSHVIPDEGVEFWFARDLMEPLGYVRWENFQTVVKRAIASCATTGYDPDDHFRGVTKMVRLGSGAERAIDDFMLTRYACYLIAQWLSYRRIGQQSADQLPWFHIVTLLTRLGTPCEREWYARESVQQGWSRDVLVVQIKSQLHLRQLLGRAWFDPLSASFVNRPCTHHPVTRQLIAASNRLCYYPYR